MAPASWKGHFAFCPFYICTFPCKSVLCALCSFLHVHWIHTSACSVKPWKWCACLLPGADLHEAHRAAARMTGMPLPFASPQGRFQASAFCRGGGTLRGTPGLSAPPGPQRLGASLFPAVYRSDRAIPGYPLRYLDSSNTLYSTPASPVLCCKLES